MSDIEKSAQTQSNEPAEPSFRYNADLAQGIEEKWQKIWDDEGTFWAANVNGDLKDGKGRNAEGRPSYFAMDMFPYPSGKGLHVGHPLGYLATDVVSRYHRMKGENVLHAMGYDAFGLPAEQYAVQTGQHPRITTEQNIANMRRQLHRMGLSFDNRRSFATIDPGYVRWTQWIFSRIYDSWYDEDATNPSGSKGCARPISTLVEQFESGEREIPGFAGKQWNDLTEAEQADVLNDFRLAYISKSPVNWCPGLGTVLANEEVTAEGKSERGNFPVFQRELRQWSMRITAYGHRLIEDLDGIDWPEKVKLMQRNWARRPACSPACTPSTRSPEPSCRCSPQTMCLWITAPAPSWPCRVATSVITISRSSSVCRSPTPCSRCRNPATIWPTMRARLRSSPTTASSSTPLWTPPVPRATR